MRPFFIPDKTPDKTPDNTPTPPNTTKKNTDPWVGILYTTNLN